MSFLLSGIRAWVTGRTRNARSVRVPPLCGLKPRAAGRLFFALVERFFIEDSTTERLVVDRRAAAQMFMESGSEERPQDALVAFDELLRTTKLVGRPARARTHVLRFSSVEAGPPSADHADKSATRSASGTVTLRMWVVDDRLYLERLSEQRGTR